MKVTSATIRLVLKKSRATKSGEFPIYLVVCYHGRVEKSTGISCAIQYWDQGRERVKNKCPNAPVLNKMLQDLRQRVIERRTSLELEGRGYTAQTLLESLSEAEQYGKNDYRGVYMRLLDERMLRSGSVRRYHMVYRKLVSYLKRESFAVDELTVGVVKDFALHMEREGIRSNSIKSILAIVASVWNFAISRKIVDKNEYPFDEFKYGRKYREIPRDYYLEESHMIRLKKYWLDLIIERDGRRWRYRDGAEERLRTRYSAEFGILWFLMSYKCNGSAPIELALLKPADCKRVMIGGEEYWAIDIKRRKTGRDVYIRMKRDVFVIVGLEHFIGCSGHFVYPIVNWYEGCSDRYITEQSHKCSLQAIKHVRKAFETINGDIARDNVEKGLREPQIDLSRLVFYTQRHSFAQHYLNRPNATVNGLASLMARSPNTIATYLAQLKRDEDIAYMVEGMPI